MSNFNCLRRPRRLRILLFVLLLAWPLLLRAEGDAGSWLSWTALQAIPSPTFTIDNGHGTHSLITSFRWQVTPLSYSWSANEMVSSVGFLKINPVRRHGGSVQIDLQPEIATRDLAHAGLGRSSLAVGSRAFFPLAEYGEYLSCSIGARYVLRRFLDGARANTLAGEIGLYTLFGLVGIQLGLGADPAARYSLSICLRYY